MMAPHSKDIYNPMVVIDETDLKETIKYLKSKGDLPKYIVLRRFEGISRGDVGYGKTDLLVYNTKSKEYEMFYYYAKNPFEWYSETLSGPYGGEVKTFDEAVDALHENLQADYADRMMRKKKISKSKPKRKIKKVVKKKVKK